MARTGRVGSNIALVVKFYINGVLTNPYSVNDVTILDASSGGNTVDTITPVNNSIGQYTATWSIPSNQQPGTYYDSWTWQGEADMTSQTRVYSFRIDGATGQKAKYGGPLFVGDREADFFNCVTKEFVQKVVSQKVIYYSVSERFTKTHQLYDEAVKKTVFAPVEVNALIMYNEPLQTATQFSIDTIYSIEVYLHYDELKERRIIPREGDFVKFGTIVYEIEKLNQPQIVYGQIQRKVMVKATCRVSRKSQFEVLDKIPGHAT
jgi:hypothetical protein